MGGTIDKVYPQKPNAYGFEIRDAKSIEILNRWENQVEYEFHTIAQKDSQDLTAEDSENLLSFISSHAANAFLITHGTDTIGTTGKYLKERLSNFAVPIVLTGSRLPASVLGSDAALNIGMSSGVIQSQETGVYIVLDGIVRELK
ncbi:MAG: L-asparaginase [Saprospiraceae bacterium]|jgi:L-asparaginase